MTNNIFNTNPESKNLSEKHVQFTYHLVALLLYSRKCTRQDIQTAVIFLLLGSNRVLKCAKLNEISYKGLDKQENSLLGIYKKRNDKNKQK